LLLCTSEPQSETGDTSPGKDVLTSLVRGINVYELALRPDGKMLVLGFSRAGRS